MTAFRHVAIASALLVGLGAAAQAQSVRTDYQAQVYGEAPVLTGRSVYVNHAPRSAAEANQIVMGLRVPYGPRTR